MKEEMAGLARNEERREEKESGRKRYLRKWKWK